MKRAAKRMARVSAPVVALLAALALARACRADAAAEFAKIHWTVGPATVPVGSMATLKLPEGYRFTDSAGAVIWSRLTENPSHGELGVLIPPADSDHTWFMLFAFDAMGYVKDDDKLDSSAAASILQSVREATEASNEERRKNGWDTMTVVGWEKAPFYDPATHFLTWGIRGRTSGGSENVNYDSRVLGRRGVMKVTLVDDPGAIEATVPTYNSLVTSIAFKPGETYAEFRSGDKVAEYGLVGLITGGTAVVAVKFWKPLMKLGAVVVAAVAGLLTKIKNLFKRKKA
ncbi:MAG TPA: DUF2167 domain-containing protein [Phycisphaerae bacterium]|nr:DUF2167 domain-containing protein [Phycisphaerae bacterium]